MILADKIITLRKKAGWSQEELASQLGVTRQSVSKWEGAQSVPDLDKVVLMSRIFGVSTDYLLKDELEEVEFVESAADEAPMRKVTMEQLLEEGDYTRKSKAHSGVRSTVSLIYWLSVTAIFLFYTYGPMGNGQPRYSWFIWAIGGVLYAAVMGAVSLIQHDKK